MAQTGYSKVQIYSSSTATNTPSAGNLTNDTNGSELAINITDGKLFYKDNSGVVQVLATKGSASGAFTTLSASSTVSGTGFSTYLASPPAIGGTVAAAGTFTTITATADSAFTSTGALQLPVGTTAQQPTGAAGKLRFNSTTSQFEGYTGTTWSSVGGAAISNDTATASNLYPLFANATSGTALTVYTSNAKYLYKPSTGDLQAPQLLANNGLILNATTLVSSYVIPAGYNAHTVGPFIVPSGLTVTVTSGQRWLVQ